MELCVDVELLPSDVEVVGIVKLEVPLLVAVLNVQNISDASHAEGIQTCFDSQSGIMRDKAIH